MIIRTALILLILLFASLPARAAEHLRYEAYWGGLHAADFALTLDEGAGKKSHWFRLETQGVIDWLIKLRVEAESIPGESYRVHYTNRRRERSLEVRYDEETGEARSAITTHSRSEDDTDEATETSGLDAEFRTGVTDPLGGLIEALVRVRSHLEGGDKTFTIPVFDGRRRFDMDGEVLGTAVRTIGDERHPVYRLRLTTRPLAGFRKSHRVLWGGSAFDLYVTRDGRFVPLQIDSVGPGPIIHLMEECERRCALPEGD